MSYDTHGYDLVLEANEKTLNSMASSAFHSSYFTSFKGTARFRSFNVPYTISLSEPPYVELRKGKAGLRLALHITSGILTADTVAYFDILVGPGIKVRNISIEDAKFWGRSSGPIAIAILNVIINALPLQKLLHLDSLDADMSLSVLVPASMLAGSPKFNISAPYLASFNGSLAAALCLNECSLGIKTDLESFTGENDLSASISEVALNDMLKDIWPNLVSPIVEEGKIESDSNDFISWLKQVSGIRRPFWGGSRAKVDYHAEIRPAMPKMRRTDNVEIYDADMNLKIHAVASMPKPFSSKDMTIYDLDTDAKAVVNNAIVKIYAENDKLFAKVSKIAFSIDAPGSFPNLILKVARSRLEEKILNMDPVDITAIFERKLSADLPFQPEFLVKGTSVSSGILTIRSDISFDKLFPTSYPFIADVSSGVVHRATCPGVAAVRGADRLGYASLGDAFGDGYKGSRDCLKRYQSYGSVAVPDINVGRTDETLENIETESLQME